MNGKYPCPCCKKLTFPVPQSEAIAYICPECRWENDLFTASDDEPSDENHGISLNEARLNYADHGDINAIYTAAQMYDRLFSKADSLLSAGGHAPFLNVLSDDCDNTLTIRLTASEVTEASASDYSGLSESEQLVMLLRTKRRIVPSGLTVTIKFSGYIKYRVRNESYFISDPDSQRIGSFLKVYENSKLLEELTHDTAASISDTGEYFPGRWYHYAVYTQNHVIDIITHNEPDIKIRRKKR